MIRIRSQIVREIKTLLETMVEVSGTFKVHIANTDLLSVLGLLGGAVGVVVLSAMTGTGAGGVGGWVERVATWRFSIINNCVTSSSIIIVLISSLSISSPC